jgi:simple sugar transport system ATP-binding protein
VSHIPEDRNKMGLIGNMSVQDNLVLKTTEEPRFSDGHGLHLKKKAIHDYALGMQEKYDIRCESVDQECRNLSGGNQQKVILARELEGDPDLLVAVHPTRGLDIGATRYVHDSMIDARARGCGVLLISADFDEVLEVSDRIIVMFEGQIMGVYSGKNPPIEEIGLAMAGK